MIDSSSPARIGVAAPSRSRTLSESTNRLTCGRVCPARRGSGVRAPGAGRRGRRAPPPPSPSRRCSPPTLTSTTAAPATRSRSWVGTRTRTSIGVSRDRRRPHRHHRRQVLGEQPPRLAVVDRGVHLAGAGAEVEPGRILTVGGEPVAQHGEVGVVLRQPGGQRLPRLAGVGRPPHDALPVGRAAVLVALQRQQVRGRRPRRVGDDREPEVHPGDPRHRRPRRAAVVAAVDAAVMLEVEALGVAGVARHLVHALAELERPRPRAGTRRRCRGCSPATTRRRRRIGRPRPPRWRSAGGRGRRGGRAPCGGTARRRPAATAGGAGGPTARATSEKLRPPSSLRNSAAGSTPAYSTSGSSAGPGASCQIRASEASAALREPQRCLLVLGPGRTEIVGAAQHRTPVVADRPGEQPRRPGARVDARGVHLLAGERRPGQLEPLAAVAGAEREQSLRRADEHHHARCRRLTW